MIFVALWIASLFHRGLDKTVPTANLCFPRFCKTNSATSTRALVPHSQCKYRCTKEKLNKASSRPTSGLDIMPLEFLLGYLRQEFSTIGKYSVRLAVQFVEKGTAFGQSIQINRSRGESSGPFPMVQRSAMKPFLPRSRQRNPVRSKTRVFRSVSWQQRPRDASRMHLRLLLHLPSGLSSRLVSGIRRIPENCTFLLVCFSALSYVLRVKRVIKISRKRKTNES